MAKSNRLINEQKAMLAGKRKQSLLCQTLYSEKSKVVIVLQHIFEYFSNETAVKGSFTNCVGKYKQIVYRVNDK